MSKKTKASDKKSQKANNASVGESQSQHQAQDQSDINQRLAVNPLSQFSLDEDELKLALVTA